MLILLPPSEGKTPARRRGAPVDPEALPMPELAGVRSRVLAALLAASGSPDALELLGVGEGLRPDVERNLRLASTPAMPAGAVYTGVLYDALDLPTLSPAAGRRASRTLRVQSALWGPVGPRDRIAPYRLSMTARLPGVGTGLAATWRSVLAAPMARLAGDQVVVDARSSSYAAAWTPSGPAARQLVAVRVFSETPTGRSVVSHAAKHTRGLVARLLLEHPGRLRGPADVAAAVASDFRCDLVDLGARGFALDVLTSSPGPLTRS